MARRKSTKYIIVHHTASSKEVSVDRIRKWHVEDRGWSDIGYHLLVDHHGAVHKGRRIDEVGAHDIKHNRDSVAVSCIGNFEEEDIGLDQFNALMGALYQLMNKYNIGWDNVLMHKDNNPTACPGKYLAARIMKMRKTKI
jgi:N-acetylmuramoyl-L-alanine amidase